MRERLSGRADENIPRPGMSPEERKWLLDLHARYIQEHAENQVPDYDEPFYEGEMESMADEQARRDRKRSNPSDWGASLVVDTPVDDNYYSAPLERERVQLPSRKLLIRLGFAAAWTGVLGGSVYADEIENPYSIVASLPIVGKDNPAKKELLDQLLVNCTDENVGEVLYQGPVSAESSMIWNVPNADGSLSPLLPTRLDPDSKVERHPKTIIESAILTVGACDANGQPAINIHDHKVRIDLAAMRPRITLEREKVHAEGIRKERLDESVKQGTFPKATADALFAEMTNPKNIDNAVDKTLHDAAEIITAKDGSYDKQIEAVIGHNAIEKIMARLKAKTPGVEYSVEVINGVQDVAIIGMTNAVTDKLSIIDTKIIKATIADPSAVNS